LRPEVGPSRRYEFVFAPVTREHLAAIDRRHHALIRDGLETHLRFEPLVATRNRQPLKRPILGAEWKIRFGPDNQFRIFYRVDEEEGSVYILAIGEKRGNRLWVGGEEIAT
jgi:mRNA-degrading endonuclease RelE of RelBE toxin-antitoxin system